MAEIQQFATEHLKLITSINSEVVSQLTHDLQEGEYLTWHNERYNHQRSDEFIG
jgi:alpha-ketoglutarate-dependent taurine dioxygenase